MRNVCKKVMGLVLATVLLAGVLPGQADQVQAKEKHSLISTSGGGGTGGICFVNGSGMWEISGGMEYISPYEAKKGETLYLDFSLPQNSKVKSTILKSSNSKVVKIENVKQGKVKAVGKGTASITVKATWKHTESAYDLTVADLKKAKDAGCYDVKLRKMKLKKGKTYSLQYVFTMKVK